MATEQLVIQVSEKGTLVVKRKLDGLGKSASKAGSGVKLLRTALGALAAVGVAQGIAQGTRLLADFAQTMSTVKGVAQATDEQFGMLRDEAKRLGETTRFSATEAAEGMLFLSRAGFSAEESLASIGDTLKLAQVGALDLGTAADIASNVLAGFRGDTSQLTSIIDVMAKAANNSNTNIQQLGQGMKFVAPVSAGLGVSVEETAAAIGTLSDAGLQATLAGTGLRKVMATLERPTSAAGKILAELGVSADKVEVSQVGLAAALQALKDAGIETGQALALFGQRGGPAFDVLVNMIPELETFTEKLQGSAGEADRVARIMDDNLNGSLLAVRSAFQAVILEFGDLGATSALRGFLDGLTTALRFVANNLEKVGVAAAVVGAVLATKFYAQGVVLATRGVQILWTTLAANPFGVLLIALTAVVAALIIFSDKITIAGEGTATLADVATVAFERIEGALSSLFAVSNTGFDETETKAASTGEIIFGVLGALAISVAQIIDKTVGLITGIFGVIIFQFERVPGAVGDLLITAFNFWVGIIEDGINRIIRGINSVSGALRIPPIDEVTIGGIFNKFEGQAKNFGDDTGAIFMEAFNNTVAQDAVISVLDEANAVAEMRRLREAAAAAGAGTGGGDPAAATPEELDVTPPVDLTKFQQYVMMLNQEAELLQMTSAQREIREGLLEAESSIGRELEEGERKQLETLLMTNQQLALQADILEQVRGPQEAYEASLAAIEALKPQLTAEEYANALRLVENTLKEATKGQEAMGQSIGATFDAGSDQLKGFVEGGKLEFKEFARSAVSSVQDIIAALIRAQSIKAIGTALGLPTFATGGSFEVGGGGGTDSQLVAFRATPGERVDVSTPAQQRAQAPMGVTAPAPKFKIVNVLDPGEIRNAMSDEEGTKVIMNQLTRNKTTARQVLS